MCSLRGESTAVDVASAPDAEAVDRSRRRLLVALAASLSGAFLLLLALVEGDWGPLRTVDEAGRDGLHDHFVHHNFQVQTLKAISRAGTFPVYAVIFLVVIVWLLHASRRRAALFVAVTVVGGYWLSPTIKSIVERPRPAPPDPIGSAGGFAFPSGHATQAMGAALVLLIVLLPHVRGRARPALCVLAGFCVVAIGFARIGLGVHWVSDVLAGYLIGAAWVALIAAILAPWPPPASSRSSPHP